TGHNSRKCTRKKRSKSRSKKRGSVNKVAVDSGSDTNTSNNDSSDNNSDSEETSSESEADINKSKSRKTKKDASTSNKSTTLEQNIRQILLDMLEKVLLPHQIERLKFEDKYLSIPDFTNHREPSPQIPDSDGEEDILDDPMEIDFVQRKDSATDIATVKCKINRLVIPAGGIDSLANFPIMTEDIAKRAKLKINPDEKHKLSGVATHTESIGTVHNVPVTFAPGCVIHSDFAVVRYRKPMLILPNPLLDKYNYDLLASKRLLKLVCNGKEHFIPINMHEVKNKLEVNCITTSQNNRPLVSDQISQETDSDKDDNITFEEWHAPAGFNLDFDDSSLKKTHEL
ncbi:7284_t:CDS:2, partial [Paraglomus brasilianum]